MSRFEAERRWWFALGAPFFGRNPAGLDWQAGFHPVALTPCVMADISVAELDQPIGDFPRALAGGARAVDDHLRVRIGNPPGCALIHPLRRHADRAGKVRPRVRHLRERVDEHERVAALDLLPKTVTADLYDRRVHSASLPDQPGAGRDT